MKILFCFVDAYFIRETVCIRASVFGGGEIQVHRESVYLDSSVPGESLMLHLLAE